MRVLGVLAVSIVSALQVDGVDDDPGAIGTDDSEIGCAALYRRADEAAGFVHKCYRHQCIRLAHFDQRTIPAILIARFVRNLAGDPHGLWINLLRIENDGCRTGLRNQWSVAGAADTGQLKAQGAGQELRDQRA